MSTAAQIITKAHRQLLSGIVEDRNKLSAQVSSTATTVSVSYDLGKIRTGAVLEIESELMYVWEVDQATKTATVERAFNGTTAAAHASGSIVTCNSRFPRQQMFEALNDELADLCTPMNGLYRIKTIDFDYNGTDTMVNLPSSNDVLDLLEVRLRYLSDDYPHIRRVSLVRNLPTKDFPSGIALKFNEPLKSGSVRVSYKSPFVRLNQEADNLQTISGYPVSAEDILVMGIQIRMMASREIKRNFTESQGDTRRADEVTAGAVANSINGLIRIRRDRIAAEATKLDSQYPILLNRD